MRKGERRAALSRLPLSCSRSRQVRLRDRERGTSLTRRDLSASCVSSLRVSLQWRQVARLPRGETDGRAGRRADRSSDSLSRPEGEAKFASVSERSSETDERETESER